MADIQELVRMKDKLLWGLSKSDDKRTDRALIRTLNKYIDAPPSNLRDVPLDKVKSFIARESLGESRKGIGPLQVMNIPGEVAMEFPAQALKHGIREGAKRTGEVFFNLREAEVPWWEKLPVDIAGFNVAGGLVRKAGLPGAMPSVGPSGKTVPSWVKRRKVRAGPRPSLEERKADYWKQTWEAESQRGKMWDAKRKVWVDRIKEGRGSGVKPTVKPATEPVVKPVTKPATRPIVKPETKAEVIAKTTAEPGPAVQPVTQPKVKVKTGTKTKTKAKTKTTARQKPADSPHEAFQKAKKEVEAIEVGAVSAKPVTVSPKATKATKTTKATRATKAVKATKTTKAIKATKTAKTTKTTKTAMKTKSPVRGTPKEQQPSLSLKSKPQASSRSTPVKPESKAPKAAQEKMVKMNRPARFSGRELELLKDDTVKFMISKAKNVTYPVNYKGQIYESADELRKGNRYIKEILKKKKPLKKKK